MKKKVFNKTKQKDRTPKPSLNWTCLTWQACKLAPQSTTVSYSLCMAAGAEGQKCSGVHLPQVLHGTLLPSHPCAKPVAFGLSGKELYLILSSSTQINEESSLSLSLINSNS